MKRFEGVEKALDIIGGFILGDYRFAHYRGLKLFEKSILHTYFLVVLVLIIVFGYLNIGLQSVQIRVTIIIAHGLLTKFVFLGAHRRLLFKSVANQEFKEKALLTLLVIFLVLSLGIYKLTSTIVLNVNFLIIIAFLLTFLFIQYYRFSTRPFEYQRFYKFVIKFWIGLLNVFVILLIFRNEIMILIGENERATVIFLIIGIFILTSLFVFKIFAMSGYLWVQILSFITPFLSLVFLQEFIFNSWMWQLYKVGLRSNYIADFLINFAIFFEAEAQIVYVISIILSVLVMTLLVPSYRLEKFTIALKILNIGLLLFGAFNFVVHPILYDAMPNSRTNAKMSVISNALDDLSRRGFDENITEFFSDDFFGFGPWAGSDGGIRAIILHDEVRVFIHDNMTESDLIEFDRLLNTLESFDQQRLIELLAMLVLPLSVSFFLCNFILDLRIKEAERRSKRKTEELNQGLEKEVFSEMELLFIYDSILENELNESVVEKYDHIVKQKLNYLNESPAITTFQSIQENQESICEHSLVHGQIVYFNSHRKYGFITGDEEERIFFHITSFQNKGIRIRKGMSVKYQLVKSEKGLKAKKITLT